MKDKIVHIACWCTALVVAVFAGACTNPDVLVNQFVPVNEQGWHTQDTVAVPLPQIRHDARYLLTVQLRTDNRYQFQGIDLEIEQEYKNPDVHRRDTVHMQMADEKGRLDGEGVNLMIFSAPVCQVSLHAEQEGMIHIRHIMNPHTLQGLQDVGLVLQTVTTGIQAQEDEQ